MPERPVNNLPPGSQPWARDIATAVDFAQFDASKANMNNRNAFKTINATLEQQAKQLIQIQAALTAAEEALSKTVLALSLGQTQSGFAVPATETTVTTSSLIVPSGYSKMFAFIQCTNHASTITSSGGTLYARATASVGAHSVSGTLQSQTANAANQDRSVTAHTRITATDLVGGETLTINGRMLGTVSWISTSSDLDGFVIFYN